MVLEVQCIGSYNLRPRHIAGCNERGIGGEEVEMRVTQKKSEERRIVESALFGVKKTGEVGNAKEEEEEKKKTIPVASAAR